MNIEVEERLIALEALYLLVNLKNDMVTFLLEPAGVPRDIYRPLLEHRDAVSGAKLTKKQMAPRIIETVQSRYDCQGTIHRLVEIVAGWTRFHLAEDKALTQETVDRARHVLGEAVMQSKPPAIGGNPTREATNASHPPMAHRLEVRDLLQAFDAMALSQFAQRRGYDLQDLIMHLLTLHDVPVTRSFIRNARGEQIDGAFTLEGWYYLVECRWREKLADIRDLDGLGGQVDRSGKQTMGLFLSINGWSSNVVMLLKQDRRKSIILMDGYDLRFALNEDVDLKDFLKAKIARLNLHAEPFFSAKEYLRDWEAASA